jgi:Icc protein
MVLLAQVSDLHIDGGEERTARAERVMGYLAALPRPVDAVLVTGDVADHGQPAEYETARELLGGPRRCWPARATTTGGPASGGCCWATPAGRGRSTRSTASTG